VISIVCRKHCVKEQLIKILYISNKEDVFLDAYLKYLGRDKFSISVLSLAQGCLVDVNRGKTVWLLKIRPSYPRPIKYFLRFICAAFFMLRFRKLKFDIIHFLNIKRENFYLIPPLHKNCLKLIITIYGRSTYLYPTKRFLFSRVYRFVDFLVFSNPGILREFSGINPEIPSEKYLVHIPPLNSISLKSDTGKSSKLEDFQKKFNIENSLIKISCSSTIHSYDQHYRVIDALKKLKNREKVLLMFLLTYGGTKEELDGILEKIKLDLPGFNVRIITTFLSDSELAAYRALTDIYINMRTSDQMSGAILESLAEGAMLISAGWLNYEILDNLGINYKKVNGFEGLTAIVDESIAGLDEYKKAYSSRNAEKIKETYSVEVVMKKWEALYCHASTQMS
jgi:glycosyltransferase involved in cell wall biosynthesis